MCTHTAFTKHALRRVCHAVLLPGYYAATMSSGAITEARPCPQKYFCPGGQPLQAGNPPAVNAQDTTLQLCPNGLWTRAPGASAALDCCKSVHSCSETPLHVVDTVNATAQHWLFAKHVFVWRRLQKVLQCAWLTLIAVCCCCSDPTWFLHRVGGDHQVCGRQLQGWLDDCSQCIVLHVLRHWCVCCGG